MSEPTKHRIEIEFCLVCKFQGRALWILPDLADEFVLVPSSNGAFTVRYDGVVIFDYREQGRFPEPKEVREAVLAASGRPPTPKRHG